MGGLVPHHSSCRLVVRKDKSPAEVLQFMVSGLEIGQQVVAVAGARCLKEFARSLTESGLKSEALIRNGRLILLTAPNCLAQLADPQQVIQRGPLRRASSLVRWVTDWSWAYGNGTDSGTIFAYQRIIHDFVRSLNAVSLCTVQCSDGARTSLLAMLADHRRAARPSRLSTQD